MGRLVDSAYAAFSRGGAAARRSTTGARLGAAPVIVTDGDRVLQIISNLLANAFRWTPDGGSDRRSTWRATNGDVAVDGRGHGPGHRARAERERIFRPFLSRDGAGDRARAWRSRGSSRSRSAGGSSSRATPGRGSRFALVLPARGAGRQLPGGAEGRRSRCGRRPRRRARLRARCLDPGEPRRRRPSSRRDQVDEQCEVVDRGRAARRAGRPRAARAGGSPGSAARAPRRADARRAAPRRGRPRGRRRRRVRAAATSSSRRVAASASSWSRARSSAASTAPGRCAPAAASRDALAAPARSRSSSTGQRT